VKDNKFYAAKIRKKSEKWKVKREEFAAANVIFSFFNSLILNFQIFIRIFASKLVERWRLHYM
jgi:hypothetical protein